MTTDPTEAIFDAAGAVTDNITQVVEAAIAGLGSCSWTSVADAISSHTDSVSEILEAAGVRTEDNVEAALADVFIYDHVARYLTGAEPR